MMQTSTPDSSTPSAATRRLAEGFGADVLAWFGRHGRTDLPWQRDPSPYRVWISEIMLQQTRVETVIPYFARFMERFPQLVELADAADDEVLKYWSGLGYYARARNLKRAAQQMRDHHQGQLPDQFAALAELPGIGRSTAGAILSLGFGQPWAILDGNVKRVLSRCFMVEGWPGSGKPLQRLWEIAETLTPQEQVGAYNQAMMDLGATLCTRAAPACPRCPLVARCQAQQTGRVAEFPAPKVQRLKPVRHLLLLMLFDAQGALLLERRPPSGIWGGLWSLPECPPDQSPHHWVEQRLGLTLMETRYLDQRRHSFSHYHLDYIPVICRVSGQGGRVMDDDRRVWYNVADSRPGGMAAPIARLLEEVAAF